MDKYCSKCKQVKEAEAHFYKDSRMPDGYRKYCKECFKSYNVRNSNSSVTGEGHAKGEEQGHSVLTESDVKMIRHELEHGATRAELARRFNTSYQNIKSIHEYRTWKHI